MKDKLSFSVFELEKTAMPDSRETVRSGYDYVSWGKDNRFPNDLYDMYQNSAILQSVINGTADYVFGSGVISAFDVVNDKYETLEDVVKRCVFDLLIFGGFAVQLMYKGGKVEAMYWLDFQKCRRSEDEKKVYYSDDWGKYAKKALEYKAWTPDTDKGTCIFYYKGHKTRGIYPVPMYIGALKSVKISTEISNFHLNNIMKGFASNAVISFNNGEPDEDTKARIEKDVKEKFCGTDNAGSFLLLFNDSKENACEIAKIQDDKFDLKYDALAKSVKEDIFIAFRATPTLFGLPNENNGFSKQEYLESFELYNKTVVVPLQKDVERAFRSIGFVIKFKTFELDDISKTEE
jgi:capsid portal protein